MVFRDGRRDLKCNNRNPEPVVLYRHYYTTTQAYSDYNVNGSCRIHAGHCSVLRRTKNLS